MEKIFLRIISIIIISFGSLLILKPAFIRNKLKLFYSRYPILHYTGEKQLTSRLGFIIAAGISFVVVGAICLFTA